MESVPVEATARREARFAGIYFAALLVYLFIHPESELEHWISLVSVPVLVLWLLRGRPRFRTVVRSLGLRRGSLSQGVGWAFALGLAIQIPQLLNPTNREAIGDVLARPGGWIYPLVALPFLILTVGTTEEVFFRGILQRRISDASVRNGWRRHAWAIGLATLAFCLYHIPYAYLNPGWPSAGNLVHAVQLAFVNGALGGVILGVVYARSGGNLLSTVLLHAMVNWVPGTVMMSQVKFGGG